MGDTISSCCSVETAESCKQKIFLRRSSRNSSSPSNRIACDTIPSVNDALQNRCNRATSGHENSHVGVDAERMVIGSPDNHSRVEPIGSAAEATCSTTFTTSYSTKAAFGGASVSPGKKLTFEQRSQVCITTTLRRAPFNRRTPLVCSPNPPAATDSSFLKKDAELLKGGSRQEFDDFPGGRYPMNLNPVAARSAELTAVDDYTMMDSLRSGTTVGSNRMGGIAAGRTTNHRQTNRKTLANHTAPTDQTTPLNNETPAYNRSSHKKAETRAANGGVRVAEKQGSNRWCGIRLTPPMATEIDVAERGGNFTNSACSSPRSDQGASLEAANTMSKRSLSRSSFTRKAIGKNTQTAAEQMNAWPLAPQGYASHHSGEGDYEGSRISGCTQWSEATSPFGSSGCSLCSCSSGMCASVSSGMCRSCAAGFSPEATQNTQTAKTVLAYNNASLPPTAYKEFQADHRHENLPKLNSFQYISKPGGACNEPSKADSMSKLNQLGPITDCLSPEISSAHSETSLSSSCVTFSGDIRAHTKPKSSRMQRQMTPWSLEGEGKQKHSVGEKPSTPLKEDKGLLQVPDLSHSLHSASSFEDPITRTPRSNFPSSPVCSFSSDKSNLVEPLLPDCQIGGGSRYVEEPAEVSESFIRPQADADTTCLSAPSVPPDSKHVLGGKAVCAGYTRPHSACHQVAPQGGWPSDGRPSLLKSHVQDATSISPAGSPATSLSLEKIAIQSDGVSGRLSQALEKVPDGFDVYDEASASLNNICSNASTPISPETGLSDMTSQSGISGLCERLPCDDLNVDPEIIEGEGCAPKKKRDGATFCATLQKGIPIVVLLQDGTRLACHLSVSEVQSTLSISCNEKLRILKVSDIQNLLYGGKELRKVETKANIKNDLCCVALHLSGSGSCIPLHFETQEEAMMFVDVVQSLKLKKAVSGIKPDFAGKRASSLSQPLSAAVSSPLSFSPSSPPTIHEGHPLPYDEYCDERGRSRRYDAVVSEEEKIGPQSVSSSVQQVEDDGHQADGNLVETGAHG